MNSVLLAALALVLMSTHAWALSCAPPNLARSYDVWAKSEKQFILARGVLKPIGSLPNKRTNDLNEQQNKHLQAVPYEFKGVLIGKTKSIPVVISVTVKPACVAVWCGGYPEGNDEAIYAMEKIGNTYLFSPTPCGGNAFYGRARKHERFIRQCMKGEGCNA